MGRYCQILKSNEISGGEDTRKVPQDDVALVYLYISIKALSKKKKKVYEKYFCPFKGLFFFFPFKIRIVLKFAWWYDLKILFLLF